MSAYLFLGFFIANIEIGLKSVVLCPKPLFDVSTDCLTLSCCRKAVVCSPRYIRTDVVRHSAVPVNTGGVSTILKSQEYKMKINAELVVKLRKATPWSQDELAIASGLNLRTIQRIEKQATASLQSKKALASVLNIDIQDLDYEEKPMGPCPECDSENIYRYKKEIDALGGSGPDLLPKLSSGIFKGAKFLPVVCRECGYVRFYASEDARTQLENSSWTKV